MLCHRPGGGIAPTRQAFLLKQDDVGLQSKSGLNNALEQ